MMLGVPYVKQLTLWSCAIASFEMVARFHGVTNFDQTQIYNRIKRPVPGVKGHWCVSNDDVMAEAAKLGFFATNVLVNYTSVPDMLATLREFIDVQKHPIIATQRTAMNSSFGHSRVIVGIEDATDDCGPLIFVHDPCTTNTAGIPPGGANRKWKADIFAAMWKPNAQTAGGQAIWIRR